MWRSEERPDAPRPQVAPEEKVKPINAPGRIAGPGLLRTACGLCLTEETDRARANGRPDTSGTTEMNPVIVSVWLSDARTARKHPARSLRIIVRWRNTWIAPREVNILSTCFCKTAVWSIQPTGSSFLFNQRCCEAEISHKSCASCSKWDTSGPSIHYLESVVTLSSFSHWPSVLVQRRHIRLGSPGIRRESEKDLSQPCNYWILSMPSFLSYAVSFHN